MTAELSLFDQTEYLETLSATVESVEPENEEQFLAEFSRALKGQADKIDACSWWIANREARGHLIDMEIERLKALKARTEREIERIERGVTRTIEYLGTDAKGKHRKLEGNTSCFALHACPPSVAITDQDLVPQEYKRVTIEMPAELWDEMTDLFEMEREMLPKIQQHVTLKCEAVDKAQVKADINAGYEIPGADLLIGKYRLVRT